MIIVNDRDPVQWHPGMTVRDVLKAMGYSYVLIVVTVNGDYVKAEDYDSFPVPDGADVKILHIAHGG